MASMGATSASTHQCSRGKLNGDMESLYTAFRSANGTLEKTTNKQIGRMVAERIYIRESYESKLSKIKPKYKSAEDYYNNVEISKVHGGKKVCDTLASISKLVIRVITRKNIAEGDIDVQLLEYGQDQDQEIVRECIYLFHDEETQQYAFLSCTDETSKQTLTRFPRTNQVMSKMFLELIQNEINGKKSDMKSTID